MPNVLEDGRDHGSLLLKIFDSSMLFVVVIDHDTVGSREECLLCWIICVSNVVMNNELLHGLTRFWS